LGHLRPILCGILSIIVHTNSLELLQCFLFQHSVLICLPMHLFLLFFMYLRICVELLTASIIHIPSSGVNISLTSQRGCSFFMESEGSLTYSNKLPFVPILSHINKIQSTLSYFLRRILIFFLASMPRPSKCSLSFTFPLQNPVSISLFPYTCNILRLSPSNFS
jgi:hypothetical protein